MNEEQTQEAPKIPPQADRTTALSLFDQAGGMNDFPVLKAFQEYIEAEQARSRKRMLGLSVFFIVLLLVVVITFSLIITAVISRDQQNMSAIAARNQELSDKLLDIALRERTVPQQPVVNVQPALPQHPSVPQPSQDAALKPLLDKIEKLTTTISSGSQQPNVQPVQVIQPQQIQQAVESPELIRMREELRRQKEAVERIHAERAKVKAEQQQLQQEREKLRQAQIEQHRRRLYPEHYAREDAQKVAAPVPPAPKPAAKVESPKSAPKPKPVVDAKPVDLKTVKPISYFDEPEAKSPAALPAKPKPTSPSKPKAAGPSVQTEPKVEVVKQPETKKTPEVKKSAEKKPDAKESDSPKDSSKPSAKKTETLNVSSQEGGTIPFLIELPETAK